MKRIVISAVCLALIFCFASCKSSGSQDSGTSTKPSDPGNEQLDANRFLLENSNLPALPGNSKSSISLDGFEGSGNTYADSDRGISYIFKGEKLHSVKVSSKNFAIMGITVGDDPQTASFMLQGSGFKNSPGSSFYSMGNIVVEVEENEGVITAFTIALKER